MSQTTQVYSTSDSQASALYPTQIQTLVSRGDRKRTLEQFNQFSNHRVEQEKPDLKRKNLQVLVTASDRAKETNFNGMREGAKKVRSNKQHLKFPLYSDEDIGFCADNPVVKASNLVSSVSKN